MLRAATRVGAMSLSESLLERTFVYKLWQAPFAEQKFAPILVHNDLGRVRRVLDVACGPGTNTHHFAAADYLGVDVNERYIQSARQRHGRNFLAADVRDFKTGPNDRFDFILVNSFLHHLNTLDSINILAHLQSLLTADGYIHMLELVLPERRSVSRALARLDRGKFARSLEEWRILFDSLFETVVFEAYPLTGAGTILWKMVYFKGKSRTT
jgi:SAM-dependent methyltransferase